MCPTLWSLCPKSPPTPVYHSVWWKWRRQNIQGTGSSLSKLGGKTVKSTHGKTQAVRIQHRGHVGVEWEVSLKSKLVPDHAKPWTPKERGRQWAVIDTYCLFVWLVGFLKGGPWWELCQRFSNLDCITVTWELVKKIHIPWAPPRPAQS